MARATPKPLCLAGAALAGRVGLWAASADEVCTQADCGWHGTTSDDNATDGCTCACVDGYSGGNCTTPPACDAAVDCSGHGTTEDLNASNGCFCACVAGYSATNCAREPSWGPAQHVDKYCEDGLIGYQGFLDTTLEQCQAFCDRANVCRFITYYSVDGGVPKAINETNSSRCRLSRSCSIIEGTVYSPSAIYQQSRACDPIINCNSHGATVDLNASDGCECRCLDGWSGHNCTLPPICDREEDCSRHGETLDDDSTNGCLCQCDDGWSGLSCDKTADVTTTKEKDNDKIAPLAASPFSLSVWPAAVFAFFAW